MTYTCGAVPTGSTTVEEADWEERAFFRRALTDTPSKTETDIYMYKNIIRWINC